MRGGVHGQHPYHQQHTTADGDRKSYDDIIELWGEPRAYVRMCVYCLNLCLFALYGLAPRNES
jgi:hypothetical protein